MKIIARQKFRWETGTWKEKKILYKSQFYRHNFYTICKTGENSDMKISFGKFNRTGDIWEKWWCEKLLTSKQKKNGPENYQRNEIQSEKWLNDECWKKWFIVFNSISTCLVLFYAYRLGNRVHCTFLFIFVCTVLFKYLFFFVLLFS